MDPWLQLQREITVRTSGQGLVDITRDVAACVAESRVETGLCTVFITHTSASLTIQEGADPSARRDLERFLERLVPENDPLYTHTAEGPDDMPSHVRSALTATTLSVPIASRRLALGTWQAVYMWEHRRRGSNRNVIVHVLGTSRSD